MKKDIARTLLGIVLIATAAGIGYKIFRRSTDGKIFRMKAPFRGQLMQYPVTSEVISGRFMEQRAKGPHLGLDLKTRFDDDGTPNPTGKNVLGGMLLFAPFDGRVLQVFSDSNGGLQMIVEADDGTRLGLAHLRETKFKQGDRFQGPLPGTDTGDIIAVSGESGGVVPHVHVTVRDPSRKLVDPAPYLGA